MIIGEISALMAAVSYAIASHLIQDTANKFSATLLSFLRNGLAMILSFLVLIIFYEEVFPKADFQLYAYLFASGIFGVGIGDTLYLSAISILGARKTILLETLTPPFTGIISYFFLGSTLSLLGWVGVAITIYGIFIVVNADNNTDKQSIEQSLITERQIEKLKDTEYGQIRVYQKEVSPHLIEEINNIATPLHSNLILGIIIGSAAMLCQALGMVLSHNAMVSGSFGSVNSTFLRLLSGIISIAVIMQIKGISFFWPQQNKKENIVFIISILVGSLIGIWCQQFSLMFTRPESAQTILSTTPIFGLMISKLKGETMKREYYVGSFTSVIGVAIVIWY